MINNYKTMIMDYMSWLSSAKIIPDLGKELNEETLQNTPGLLFGDMSHIEIRIGIRHSEHTTSGISFGCITGREEIETENLMEAIDFLWNTHSSMEWGK